MSTGRSEAALNILTRLIALLRERNVISEDEVQALFDEVKGDLAEDRQFVSRAASDVVTDIADRLEKWTTNGRGNAS